MDEIKSIRTALQGMPSIHDIDVVETGYVRIATKFLYPEGGFVDVFLEPRHCTSLKSAQAVSDLGGTLQWLLDIQLGPNFRRGGRRREIIESVLELHGAREVEGAYEIPIRQPDREGLNEAIFNLGQVCIKIADLIYTQRFSRRSARAHDARRLDSETDHSSLTHAHRSG
ncbi:DUF1828 domain-containing protein [bacterium]|nr:DUF1828 domain-containing protein [bacterium]